jgi:hypothetical protein
VVLGWSLGGGLKAAVVQAALIESLNHERNYRNVVIQFNQSSLTPVDCAGMMITGQAVPGSVKAMS